MLMDVSNIMSNIISIIIIEEASLQVIIFTKIIDFNDKILVEKTWFHILLKFALIEGYLMSYHDVDIIQTRVNLEATRLCKNILVKR